MYSSSNAWDMDKKEKELTKKDVEDMIINTLMPYLKEEYTEEGIREKISDISFGGRS